MPGTSWPLEPQADRDVGTACRELFPITRSTIYRAVLTDRTRGRQTSDTPSRCKTDLHCGWWHTVTSTPSSMRNDDSSVTNTAYPLDQGPDLLRC